LCAAEECFEKHFVCTFDLLGSIPLSKVLAGEL